MVTESVERTCRIEPQWSHLHGLLQAPPANQHERLTAHAHPNTLTQLQSLCVACAWCTIRPTSLATYGRPLELSMRPALTLCLPKPMSTASKTRATIVHTCNAHQQRSWLLDTLTSCREMPWR